MRLRIVRVGEHLKQAIGMHLGFIDRAVSAGERSSLLTPPIGVLSATTDRVYHYNSLHVVDQINDSPWADPYTMHAIP